MILDHTISAQVPELTEGIHYLDTPVPLLWVIIEPATPIIARKPRFSLVRTQYRGTNRNDF